MRIWETRNWQEVYCATDSGTDSGEDIGINGLAFGRGADLGLLATSGRGLRIWWVRRTDKARPSLRPIAECPGFRCLHVALSPDGTRAAYVDSDYGIKLWDVAQDRELPFSGPRLLFGWHSLAFCSPRELVYITSDRVAVVWDVIADRLIRTIGQPGTFEGFHIAVSPDGRWLAAEATPSSVAIVDLDLGEVVFTFREEKSPIWSLAWSPDARRLAVGLSDGGLVLWDLEQVRADWRRPESMPPRRRLTGRIPGVLVPSRRSTSIASPRSTRRNGTSRLSLRPSHYSSRPSNSLNRSWGPTTPTH